MKTLSTLAVMIFGIVTASYSQTTFCNSTLAGDVTGHIGIGTTTPSAPYALSVKGKVIAIEATMMPQSAWPDYVFLDNYPLISLPELKKYIDANHHLPDVPDAKSVEANGIEVGEMSSLLLKKTEELTLYLLQLDERMRALEKARE